MSAFRSRLGVAVLSMAAIGAGYFGAVPLLERLQYARAVDDVEATRANLQTVQDLSAVFRHVGKVVEPSVVQITVLKTVKEPQLQLPQQFRFFGQGPDGQPLVPQQGNGGMQEFQEKGTGSGVIMEVTGGYGYILTNNHVAGDASDMDIRLDDGRDIHGAKLMGADPKSDLAVVRIQADRLIPAVWGNSDELQKGDWVMAFGSPFGFVGSMTHGIVSALDRQDVGTGNPNAYEDFIQVDAPINPGNSGGPLVNIRGEVIGINTAIATNSGAWEGIGFAIPSNQAKQVYAELKDHGRVVRGWLGIGIEDVANDPALAHSFHYNGTTGVIVEDVYPGTPAADKLDHGDIIVGLNGQATDTSLQLRTLVANTSPGTSVKLKIFRDGQSQSVDLTIGNQPDDVASIWNNQQGPNNGAAPQATTGDALGMSFQTLDPAQARQAGATRLLRNGGAELTSVSPDSIAGKAGLSPGDVIIEINRAPIRSAEDATTALKGADLKTGVRLYVVRQNTGHYVFLQQGGDANP